jgi:predicted nucleic-acid-binding protein
MIGIDTNVLIRYIVQDDPLQSKLAVTFMEKNCTKSNPGFVNLIVCCEIVWVLHRAYNYNKDTIIRVMKQILLTSELYVEDAETVRKSLHDFENGNADFSDYIISHINSECEYTVTFDKNAAKIPLCKLLS